MSTLVGKQAPHFNTRAIVDQFPVKTYTLDQFQNKKYVVLFFYPKDFAFVCPTELHAFQEKLPEFYKRNVEVCPANWNTGKAGMKATFKGVADYLAANEVSPITPN